MILREKPLILMPKKIFDDDDPNYIENWLDRRINRMSSEEREIFFSLADSRSVNESGFLKFGAGSSIAVEHAPRNREVTGSNSTGYWAFPLFSILSVLRP